MKNGSISERLKMQESIYSENLHSDKQENKLLNPIENEVTRNQQPDKSNNQSSDLGLTSAFSIFSSKADNNNNESQIILPQKKKKRNKRT